LTVLWEGSGFTPVYTPDRKRKVAKVSAGPKEREIIGMSVNGVCIQETTYRYGQILFKDGGKVDLKWMVVTSEPGGQPHYIR
jgi:hypothetical protein